jgi:hypothetical protein
MTKTETLDRLRKLERTVKARIDADDQDELLLAVAGVCRLHRRILDGCRADNREVLELTDEFIKNTLKMLGDK